MLVTTMVLKLLEPLRANQKVSRWWDYSRVGKWLEIDLDFSMDWMLLEFSKDLYLDVTTVLQKLGLMMVLWL